MLGCKMEATPFLETSGGSGYTRLDKINVAKAAEYIVSCRNLDGGFWYIAGGEFHAGQTILGLSFHLFAYASTSNPLTSRWNISSAVLVHFLLPGLCNMLTRAFLAGGYARDKSNLEVLMVALTNFLMRFKYSGLLLLVGSFKLDHDWQSPTGSIRTGLLSSSWTVRTWKMEEFQIDLMMPLMSSIHFLE